MSRYSRAIAFLLLVGEIFLLAPGHIPAVSAASSLSFAQEEYLRNSSFYEENGILKPVDTTLQQTDDSFAMNQARYHFNASKNLSTSDPFTINYNNLSFSLTPLHTQTSAARLIENGKEVSGKDNPTLINKGLVYSNAYGKDTSLGFIADPFDVQKIVRIDNKEAMERLRAHQSTLDFSFQLHLPADTVFTVAGKAWDQSSPLTVTNQAIKMMIGETEGYIQPAKVWDAAGNEQYIMLTLAEDDQGNIILTKYLPQEFLETASYPIYTDATISFGTEATFNAANTTSLSIATLDSTHVVVVYKDVGNSNRGNAIVGTISGTSISYGTEATFNAAITNNPTVAALDSTHVVIVYQDAGNSNRGNSVVGTISGNSISFSAEVTFNSGVTTEPLVTSLSDTQVVIAYRDDSAGTIGNSIVGTVSAGVISYGTEVTFNSAATTEMSVTAIDSTHVVVIYTDGGDGGPANSRVGTISGTSISYGTEVTFKENDGSDVFIIFTLTKLDSTHVMGIYQNLNGDNAAIVGTISGTDISFGTEAILNSNYSSYFSAVAIDATHVVIAYLDGDFSSAYSLVSTITGTSVTYGATELFDTGQISFTTLSRVDSSHVALAYYDETAGNAIIGTVDGLGNTLTGTVYTDEGTTTIGANKTVAVSINGVDAETTAETNSSGNFTLTDVSTTAGDVLTFYLDGETEKGVTVTLASGTNQTGLNLYQNRLITRCDNSCSLTNGNLNIAEVSGDTDITSVFTVDSSVLNVKAGKALIVPASHSFAPGGNVNVGSGITVRGTLDASTRTITLSGSWLNTGTFTRGTSSVRFNGPADVTLNTGGTGNAYSFSTLTVNKSAGTLSLTGNALSGALVNITSGTFSPGSLATTVSTTLTINGGTFSGASGPLALSGSLTLSSGTLTAPSSTFSIWGNWTKTGGTFDSNGGTVIFAGGRTQTLNTGGTTSSSDFSTITVNKSAGTLSLSTNALSGSLLTLTAGTLAPGARFMVLGGLTINGGTLTGSTGNISLSGSLLLSSGTLTAPSGTFDVTGNWTKTGGTFTPGTNTVTLSGPNQTLNGSTTFYNLIKTITSADTLTFEAGSTQTITNTLTLQGASSNLLSLRSSANGTQWNIDPQATRTIAYLDIKDSNNTNATAFDCASANCTDSGNNTNWTFPTVTVTAQTTSQAAVAQSGGGRRGSGSRQASEKQSSVTTPSSGHSPQSAVVQTLTSMRARLAGRIEKRIIQYPSIASLLRRVLLRLDERIAIHISQSNTVK